MEFVQVVSVEKYEKKRRKDDCGAYSFGGAYVQSRTGDF